MKRFGTNLLGVALAASLVTYASADSGRRTYMVTDAKGAYVVTDAAPGSSGGGGIADAGDVLWTFSDADSIPQSVALCPAGGTAWAGQYLNFERLQRFELLGDGTPTLEVPAGSNSISIVAACPDADLAAHLDLDDSDPKNTAYKLAVYKSIGAGTVWDHTFPANIDGASFRSLAFSRDGSKLACYVYDSGATTAELHFFNAATGAPQGMWTYPGALTALDLSDDGSLCFVTQSTNGRLIDTGTLSEIFSAPGSGGGNTHHKMSGDGGVLALGGFRLEIYVKTGPSYTRVLNFSAPTSWFGRGLDVSRDGTTVGAIAHDYGASYLNTTTRVFDVATTAMLGEHTTIGSGAYQDAVSGAAISDDGSVFAASSWGTQDNVHAEVMLFDRDCNLIGEIDTDGSVFALDLTPDGVYALCGSKSIHANVSGRGGDVTSYQVLDAGRSPIAGGLDGEKQPTGAAPFPPP